MPTQHELNDLIAVILEIPEGSVTDDSNLEELGWDSLSDVTFISMVDERYGAHVDPRQLNRSETPTDLLALLEQSAA